MTTTTQAQIARFPEASSTHACMTFDADWRCTAISHAGAEIFGKSVEDIRGRVLMDLVPNAPLTPLGEVLFRTADTRHTHIVTVPSVLHPGRQIWARVSPSICGGVRVCARIVPTQADVARVAMAGCGFLLAMSSTILSYAEGIASLTV
jgi:PAS domain S-box-containing protein